jgi:hypothetical protein
MAFAKYWHRPQLTANTLDDAGYIRTGDVGFRDDSGYLHLVGTIGDVEVVRGAHPPVRRTIIISDNATMKISTSRKTSSCAQSDKVDQLTSQPASASSGHFGTNLRVYIMPNGNKTEGMFSA